MTDVHITHKTSLIKLIFDKLGAGATRPATPQAWADEAWTTAVDQGLVDPDKRHEYDFELVKGAD